MITVDFKDRRPIYLQIVENIKLLISKGALSENEKLPSVRSLSLELGINPNTIQRAYGELERQGVINTVQGKGVFVSSETESVIEERKKEALRKFSAALSEAKSAGVDEKTILEFVKASFNGEGGNQ
ncbi:MAG: GntR family transcriptional regulator [Ruminococcaceae bacterium]|nr:GntR family transcriptional regulator [Oscillospiraceae bacterium]